MICLLYAHPYPNRSRANKVLLEAVQDVPGLDLRSLYDLYPDFAIDVEAEQAALSRADLIVLQHPLYWYSVPGLLKHWFDKVLALHWAYGDGGVALHGKTCLWVTTTGAPEHGYQDDGMHRRPFRDFVPTIEQTARFCGMHWAEPLVVFGAHRVGHEALVEHGRQYRERLLAFAARGDDASPAQGKLDQNAATEQE
jgi:glutathione-regulated potassium-efflux system ancillary protein KefF